MFDNNLKLEVQKDQQNKYVNIKPEKNTKSKLYSSKLNILFTELIIFGIIGTTLSFYISIVIKSLVIAVVLILNAFFIVHNICLFKKNKELNLKNYSKDNNVYKREIVTEMSFDAELIGSNTAYLVTEKAGTMEKIFINKAEFKIGRLPSEVDYVSDNMAVGKVHAAIKSINNKYYIVDLNSKNGTYINKQRIESNELYEIKNEDSIIFANSQFKFFN